jgi:hypothetical protein
MDFKEYIGAFMDGIIMGMEMSNNTMFYCMFLYLRIQASIRFGI